MPDRLMGIDYLIQTEENVRDQTIQEWGEELEKLTQTIELIFRLSHFLVEDVEIDSEDHAFHNIAYSAFIRLPYTLKSIRNLWFSGYYLESYILIRHVLEGYVSLRYFNNNKDKIIRHYTANRSRGRISFRTMFDSISPNFYPIHYGNILSGFSHGGIIAYNTRTEYSSQTDGRAIVGCEYNLRNAKLIVTMLLTYCYGYLNYLDIFFPSINDRLPNQVNSELNYLKSDIWSRISIARQNEDQQQEWENVIRPLIE